MTGGVCQIPVSGLALLTSQVLGRGIASSWLSRTLEETCVGTGIAEGAGSFILLGGKFFLALPLAVEVAHPMDDL